MSAAFALVLFLLAQPPATAPAEATPPRLQFRLVAENDAAAERRPTLRPEPDGEASLPLEKDVLLSGRNVEDVAAAEDQSGGETIRLRLTPAGAERLRQATRDAVGRRLAIVLDGTVLVAPTIRSAIGRDVVISFGRDAGQGEVAGIETRLRAATRPAE